MSSYIIIVCNVEELFWVYSTVVNDLVNRDLEEMAERISEVLKGRQ